MATVTATPLRRSPNVAMGYRSNSYEQLRRTVSWVGLILVHIVIICTLFSGESGVGGHLVGQHHSTKFGPMTRAEEVRIIDGPVDYKENLRLLEVLNFGGGKWSRMGIVTSVETHSLDFHIDRGIVRHHHSGHESVAGRRIVQFGLFSVLDGLNNKRAMNDSPSGSFAIVNEMQRSANWGENLIRSRKAGHGNFYPGALILSHRVELSAHKYELVDAGGHKSQGEYGKAPVSKAATFSHFAKAHRTLLFCFALGVFSLGGTWLLFGSYYYAVHDWRPLHLLLCVLLGVLLFWFVFTFAHASYD